MTKKVMWRVYNSNSVETYDYADAAIRTAIKVCRAGGNRQVLIDRVDEEGWILWRWTSGVATMLYVRLP